MCYCGKRLNRDGSLKRVDDSVSAMNYTTLSERFHRSGDTISRAFHDVLNALVGRRNGFDGMVRRLIKPRDPTFKHIPNKIVFDERYDLFEVSSS